MSAQTCAKCQKTVYPLEMINACNKPWHKGCFRCTHCDNVLSIKGFATINEKPYCKPHYLELFKSKGNYAGITGGADSNKSSSFNTGGFKGVDFTSPSSKLKHAETVDKSAPVIEKDVKVKKVDRTGFLEEVSKPPVELKHPETVHDSSAPKIPPVVKLPDHKELLQEIHTSPRENLKHTETVDKSVPVIESVEIKKVDRKEILKEGVVEHPPKLRQVDEYVNDRSDPIIEPTVTVKKDNQRNVLFKEITKAADDKPLKHPEAQSDRSSPKVPGKAPKNNCAKCGKAVYDLEALKACDKTYHKGCFRCKKCDGVLGLKGFAAIEGEPYCKPHYLEIFKSKGTYKAFGDDKGSTSYNASQGFKGYV